LETKKLIYGVVLIAVLALAYYGMNSFNSTYILSLKYPEISECVNITDDLLKGTCYQKIAIEKNDSNICDLAPNFFSASECYTQMARLNEDSEICGSIKNKTLSDNCYHNLAVLKNDPNICEKITYGDSKYKCLAIIKKDPLLCDSIESDLGYDWCLYAVAIKKEDALICENIKSDETRDKCYLGYVERNNLGSGFCNRILNSTIRDECRNTGIRYICPISQLKIDRINTTIV